MYRPRRQKALRQVNPPKDVSTSLIPNHICDAAVASHFQLPWSLTSDSRASSRFGKCILHLTACRTTTIPRPKSHGGRSPRDPWIVWCPRKFRRRLLWPLKWPKKPRHSLVNLVVYLFFLLLMTLKMHLYHYNSLQYIHNITQLYNYILIYTIVQSTMIHIEIDSKSIPIGANIFVPGKPHRPGKNQGWNASPVLVPAPQSQMMCQIPCLQLNVPNWRWGCAVGLETPIPKVSYEMYVILRDFCRLFAHGSLFLHHGSSL